MYIIFRYEFQTGKGSGNLPHIHCLFSLEDDQDKEEVFRRITAKSTSFEHDNRKFGLEECLNNG